MKSILIKLFFREKFVGQIAALVASAIASYLISILPNAPEFVTSIIGVVMNLPEGSVITQGGITAFLVPLFMWAINAVVQQLIAKDNNILLQTLKSQGVYNGPMDSWVGPIATKGVGNALGRLP